MLIDEQYILFLSAFRALRWGFVILETTIFGLICWFCVIQMASMVQDTMGGPFEMQDDEPISISILNDKLKATPDWTSCSFYYLVKGADRLACFLASFPELFTVTFDRIHNKHSVMGVPETENPELQRICIDERELKNSISTAINKTKIPLMLGYFIKSVQIRFKNDDVNLSLIEEFLEENLFKRCEDCLQADISG